MRACHFLFSSDGVAGLLSLAAATAAAHQLIPPFRRFFIVAELLPKRLLTRRARDAAAVPITPTPNQPEIRIQATMKTNGFTLQIINAETREPMKEFQCPEGKLYVEAEPDVSAFLIIFMN